MQPNDIMISHRTGKAKPRRQLVSRKKIKSTFMVDGKIYVYDLSDTGHVIRNEIEFPR